jgi:hypothetical protein
VAPDGTALPPVGTVVTVPAWPGSDAAIVRQRCKTFEVCSAHQLDAELIAGLIQELSRGDRSGTSTATTRSCPNSLRRWR